MKCEGKGRGEGEEYFDGPFFGFCLSMGTWKKADFWLTLIGGFHRNITFGTTNLVP